MRAALINLAGGLGFAGWTLAALWAFGLLDWSTLR